MSIALNKRELTLHEISKLQDELNTKADRNNPDWLAVRTVADFDLAAIMELAELTDSVTWKWWKKGDEADMWNVKIEVIDAIHFLVSKLILLGVPAAHVWNFRPIEQDNLLIIDGKLQRTLMVNLMADLHSPYPCQTVELIQELCAVTGISAEELSAIYVAKHTLNAIRYEGGYHAGLYKKIKQNGLEDNVFLQSIVTNFLDDPDAVIGSIEGLVIETMKELDPTVESI